MGLFNKSENWWLRLTIVLIFVGFMSFLASTSRYQTESNQLLSKKVDSLSNELIKCQTNNGFIPGGDIEKGAMSTQIDVLNDSIFYLNHRLGLLELWIDELDNPKQYKGLKKAIEKKENSNNYE